MAEKLAILASKKSYLWRLLNAYYTVEIDFFVPAGAFSPPPKVESAVITVIKGVPKLAPEEYKKMLVFLEIISGLKRKTLGKIAKIRGETLLKHQITIPLELYTKRSEELTREELKKIVATV
ncbi:MAG: hypothetical protein H6765_05450 [Candidatus Peribacteria bacterium]|nr:MAG: hypothetical protein H6765_05450 [Candidatus Peribacteria bacterium]